MTELEASQAVAGPSLECGPFPSLAPPHHSAWRVKGQGCPPTLVWVLSWEAERGWVESLDHLIEIMGTPWL